MSWSCFWYLPLLLSVGRTIEYFCKARFVRRKVIRRSLHQARRTENFITDIEMTKSSVICKAPIVISKQTVLLSAYGSNRNVYTRKQRLEIMTLPWKKNPQCNMLVGTFKGFFWLFWSWSLSLNGLHLTQEEQHNTRCFIFLCEDGLTDLMQQNNDPNAHWIFQEALGD